MVFSLSALWLIRIRGLWKLPGGRDWLWEKLGLVLMDGAMLSKSLIQYSVDGWGCVLSLLFDLRPTLSAPDPEAGHPDPRLCQRLLNTHRQGWVSLLWGHCSFLLGPGAHKVLFVLSKSLFPQSCVSSVIKSHWPPKSNSLGVLRLFARSPGWEICWSS